MGNKFLIALCLAIALQDTMGAFEKRSYNPRFRNVNKKYLQSSSDDGEILEDMYLIDTNTKKLSNANVFLVSMPDGSTAFVENEVADQKEKYPHASHQLKPQKPSYSSLSEAEAPIRQSKPIVLQLLGWAASPPQPIALPPMPIKDSDKENVAVPIVIKEEVKPLPSESMIPLSQQEIKKEPNQKPASTWVEGDKKQEQKKPIVAAEESIPVFQSIPSKPLSEVKEPQITKEIPQAKPSKTIQDAIIADMKAQLSAGGLKKENKPSVMKEQVVISSDMIPETLLLMSEPALPQGEIKKEVNSVDKKIQAEREKINEEVMEELVSAILDMDSKKPEAIKDSKLQEAMLPSKTELKEDKVIAQKQPLVSSIVVLSQQNDKKSEIVKPAQQASPMEVVVSGAQNPSPIAVEQVKWESKHEMKQQKPIKAVIKENATPSFLVEEMKVQVPVKSVMKDSPVLEQSSPLAQEMKVQIPVKVVMMDSAAVPVKVSPIDEEKLTMHAKPEKNEMQAPLKVTLKEHASPIADEKIPFESKPVEIKEQAPIKVVLNENSAPVKNNVPALAKPEEIKMQAPIKVSLASANSAPVIGEKITFKPEEIKEQAPIKQVLKDTPVFVNSASLIMEKLSWESKPEEIKEQLPVKEGSAASPMAVEKLSWESKPEEIKPVKNVSPMSDEKLSWEAKPEEIKPVKNGSPMAAEKLSWESKPEEIKPVKNASPMAADKLSWESKPEEVKPVKNASPMAAEKLSWESKPEEIQQQSPVAQNVSPVYENKDKLISKPEVTKEHSVESVEKPQWNSKIPVENLSAAQEPQKSETIQPASSDKAPVATKLKETSSVDKPEKEVAAVDTRVKPENAAESTVDNHKAKPRPGKRPCRPHRPHKKPHKKPTTTTPSSEETTAAASSTTAAASSTTAAPSSTTQQAKIFASAVVPDLGY